MALPPDFVVPADWQPAIDHLTGLISVAGSKGNKVLVVPTRHVGMRPSTAEGVAGGYTFAQAVTAHIDQLVESDPRRAWVVNYCHEERCFIAVNVGWIRLTTKPMG